MKKHLVFIASGGRTGTRFLGETLKTVIDDCWSEHEPDMVSGLSFRTLKRIHQFGVWHMLIGRAFGAAGVRALGQRYLKRMISEQVCIDRLRKSRERYHWDIDADLIVESYAAWWMFAGKIHLIWPDAKTVGIIRDPRDWIESWRQHYRWRRNGSWVDMFPPGPLTPESMHDAEWAARWSSFSPLGKLAWDWKTIYGHLHRASLEAPDVVMFRFEDIFDRNNDNELASLMKFITKFADKNFLIRDFDNLTKTIVNRGSGNRRHWRNWSAKDARTVDELCGPLMRKFNYGHEAEWHQLLE